MFKVNVQKFLCLLFYSLLIAGCSGDTSSEDDFDSFIGLWTERNESNVKSTFEIYLEFVRVSDQPAYNYYSLDELLGNCYTKDLNMIRSLGDGQYEHIDISSFADGLDGKFEIRRLGEHATVSYVDESSFTIATPLMLINETDVVDIPLCLSS